jgi:hypothetical protein
MLSIGQSQLRDGRWDGGLFRDLRAFAMLQQHKFGKNKK